ncbi:hypothetical protein FOA43_004585 [Brettanomyces nanus]|uniref:Rho-GAP domain-containing protein n=1 Tax=Eeniella nana TaxID=13502 RepID=A0A875SCJ4_EENNA|nr:uncharacterized protein FOA43_004585 [Brettanomyces nanus]QPG77179.1 hypothetical protein FOA43_004585 [Brettanomyces nanus]
MESSVSVTPPSPPPPRQRYGVTSHLDPDSSAGSIPVDYSSSPPSGTDVSEEMDLGSVHEFVRLPMQEFNRDLEVQSKAEDPRIVHLETENTRLKEQIQNFAFEMKQKDDVISSLQVQLGKKSTSSDPANEIELPERSERRAVIRDSVVSAASSSYSKLSPIKVIPRSPVHIVANPLTPPSQTQRSSTNSTLLEPAELHPDSVSQVLIGKVLARSRSNSRHASPVRPTNAGNSLTFHNSSKATEPSSDDRFEFEKKPQDRLPDRSPSLHSTQSEFLSPRINAPSLPPPRPPSSPLSPSSPGNWERTTSSSSDVSVSIAASGAAAATVGELASSINNGSQSSLLAPHGISPRRMGSPLRQTVTRPFQMGEPLSSDPLIMLPPPSRKARHTQQAHQIPHDVSPSLGLSTGSAQYDYLVNSIDTTVISVYSVLDPEALMGSEEDDFTIQFMVNSSERDGELIPLYMVKKRYSQLLTMDLDIRREMFVNLPKLPDTSHFLKIDPTNWDTQKTIVRMYVAELCRVMRQNKRASVWKLFTEYFNPDEDHDMSKREGFFVSVGSRGLKKSYKLIRLEYDTIEHLICIEDLHSKLRDVMSVAEIVVTRDGQILTVSKRKKRTFKTNHHWTLYCESGPDAEEWYKLLTTSAREMEQISPISASGSSVMDGASVSSSSRASPSPRRKNFSQARDSLKSGLTPSTSSNDSSKWFGLRLSRDTLHIPHSTSSTSSALAVDTVGMGSNMSSPQSKASIGRFSRSADSLNPKGGVLEFKAMAYEGTSVMASPTSQKTASPLLEHPRVMETGVFQKIEELPKYFGSTLEQAYETCPKYKISGCPVPSIVYRCITYLDEKNAVFNEGIFRLNGMMSEVNKLQRIFNDQGDCDFVRLESPPDVHSIATLLKRFLRTLHITIIPESEAKMLLQLTMSTGYDADTVKKFKQVLGSLPKLNHDVLYVLFRYFQEVLKFRELNKMSVGALSVLMAPNLTPFDGAKEICSELLINYSYYFEDGKIITAEERSKV